MVPIYGFTWQQRFSDGGSFFPDLMFYVPRLLSWIWWFFACWQNLVFLVQNHRLGPMINACPSMPRATGFKCKYGPLQPSLDRWCDLTCSVTRSTFRSSMVWPMLLCAPVYMWASYLDDLRPMGIIQLGHSWGCFQVHCGGQGCNQGLACALEDARWVLYVQAWLSNHVFC